MGVPLQEAQNALGDAIKQLFAVDPRVRAVGIGAHGDAYGFNVIRNSAQILPLAGGAVRPMPAMIQNVPVVVFDRQAEVELHVRVPCTGPGSPGLVSLVPEQKRHRPLVCGLQIENFDDDMRTGIIASGDITIGTLGCFVRLQDGATALLSNNHVVAGENRAIRGTDRILQPGNGPFTTTDHAATLADYVDLRPSPAGASPGAGTVVWNDVDAGIALLVSGVPFQQGFLSSRHVPPPSGIAAPAINDRVFKVGRTTGLTHGIVTSISTAVGPIPYGPGPCWFQDSLTIEGLHGTMFSDHGDSGSAILKEGTGQVVGLLYAGNGTDTFACAIQSIFAAFGCTLG